MVAQNYNPSTQRAEGDDPEVEAFSSYIIHSRLTLANQNCVKETKIMLEEV